MITKRSSGILLHPTSLPSKYGIGDMGYEAYSFLDFLHNSHQSLWQILPLNPPGYGESPYQCFSALAGNHYLISIDKLMEEGYLQKKDYIDPPDFNTARIEFQKVKEYKDKIFKKSYNTFKNKSDRSHYQEYVEANKNWLVDYCFFMALKDHHNGKPWNQWDEKIAFRTAEGINYYAQLLKDEIEYYQFLQYIFNIQWVKLKTYANEKGIKIIGDIPIFVSYDSSDAWTLPHLFELDKDGYPLKVAGVPPDLFSKYGQLWGNPHFRWNKMQQDDFLWWRNRIAKLLELVDIIRIDHFRGFEAYWEIPASEKTARIGKWVKAPGEKLFATINKNLNNPPIIVEDLGFITPEVISLKNKFKFPGMKILQFSFGKNNVKRDRPTGFNKNTVVYTGTHDNETIMGWYKSIKETNNKEVLCNLNKYYGIDTTIPAEDVCWKLIELSFQTSSQMAILPLQDVLCKDNNGRMNYPGTVGGTNWRWRFEAEEITPSIEERLRKITKKYNRG